MAELETQIREWADELGTLNIEIILDFNTTANFTHRCYHPSGILENIRFPDETSRCFYFPTRILQQID